MSFSPIVKFARSFIYASNISPAYEFVKEIDLIIWDLKHEQLYSLLMEEAVIPVLENVNNAIPKIVKVAWSPKNLISPSQCVLAILTTTGAIDLLHKVSNKWYSICDITSLWLNIVRDKIKCNLTNCKKTDNHYKIIVENIRRLLACSVTWSELFTRNQTYFTYLSVAYLNGEILIWKVPRISSFNTSLQPVVVGEIDLSIPVKINVLCWISLNMEEHLLIIGYYDGRICGVKLKCSDSSLQIGSTEKYIDPDRIPVEYLCVIFQDKTSVKIFAVKGIFLFLLCINWTGKLQSTQYLQADGFNITGTFK